MKKVYIIDSTVKEYDFYDKEFSEHRGITPYFFETKEDAIKHIMGFEDVEYDEENYEWNYKYREGCYQEITSTIIEYLPSPKEDDDNVQMV